jgi:hypothetical protein
MSDKKNSGRVFLIIACVLTLITFVSSAILAVMMILNIGGINDYLIELMVRSGSMTAVEADSEVSMLLFTFLLQTVVELSFGLFYVKAIRYRANSISFARRLMSKAIWQCILGSLLPAVFAMIAAGVMSKQRETIKHIPVNEANVVDDNKLPEYKLTAMSEAIARLKELKDKGAISEEEYYANLNRILEG